VVAGGVIVWRAGGPAGGRGFGSLLAGLQEGQATGDWMGLGHGPRITMNLLFLFL